MNSEASFDRFVSDLRQLLADLPGQEAQFQMAPEYRKSFDLSSLERPYTEAAVMVLFYPDRDASDVAKLLLTLRPTGMSNHGGQVAFPGGRREVGEQLVETALRETEEEIFIPSQKIKLIGELTSLYIPPSNFLVHPFVGAVSEFPDMAATSDEVETLFGVTVEELLDASIATSVEKSVRGDLVSVPAYRLNGLIVWGATAMMLSELVTVLKRT